MTTKLLLQSGLLNMTRANHHPEFPLSLGHCPTSADYSPDRDRTEISAVPYAPPYDWVLAKTLNLKIQAGICILEIPSRRERTPTASLWSVPG